MHYVDDDAVVGIVVDVLVDLVSIHNPIQLYFLDFYSDVGFAGGDVGVVDVVVAVGGGDAHLVAILTSEVVVGAHRIHVV